MTSLPKATWEAHVWTIEFQKHGLPYIHMIIFLHPDDKLQTPEDKDSLLFVEFSDEDEEPELFELVKKLMVHSLWCSQSQCSL